MRAEVASATLGITVTVRSIRGLSLAGISAATVALTALAAHAQRSVASANAATEALQGPAFGLAIPISTWILVTLALGRRRLDDALQPVAVLGAHRRFATLGAFAAVGLVTALLSALTACVATLVAHGPPTVAGAADALISARIGALAAVSYAALFLAASTFGRRGGARGPVLLADLALGHLPGAAAIVFPRAHALNLLGAPPVLGLSQAISTVALLTLTCVFVLVAVLRTRA